MDQPSPYIYVTECTVQNPWTHVSTNTGILEARSGPVPSRHLDVQHHLGSNEGIQMTRLCAETYRDAVIDRRRGEETMGDPEDAPTKQRRYSLDPSIPNGVECGMSEPDLEARRDGF